MGLAEISESNPLKVLHSKLEYTGREEGVSFVGISNYSLDAAKINRALVLSVPDLDQKLDDLIQTSCNIVESISDKLKKEIIFEILSKTYFNYKNILQFIKELVVYKKFVTEIKISQTILEPKKKYFENNNLQKKKNIDNKKESKEGIEESNKSNSESNNIQDNLNFEKIKEFKESLQGKADSNKSYSENKKEIENNSRGSIVSRSDYNGEEEQNNNKKDQSNKDKKNEREKRSFESIKELKEFKDLLKKEDKIRKDFHGNRDFYNLIKGIAIELGKLGDSNDNDKVLIIIKYIERNFGGIDYEIDIDLNLKLDDIIEKVRIIKNILEDYDSYNENKKTKLSSVYLFKKLYNIQFEKSDPNSSLKIDKNKINEYNLNNCINDNIKDTNSRYLLLEVKPSLTTLIYQNIRLQNPFKEIILYDGSPFPDDNNKEYRFKKINCIQDDAKDDKLIILEKLNQIHPFLFDLYNMNYIIKDEKKFARICLEVFNEQLALINDKFRIIILVDRRFVNQCGLAFLNRLEKMILSFDKLIDNELKIITNNLMEDIKLKSTIDNYKNINYSLKDLLINCGTEEIQGLIYYFSKQSKKIEDESNNEDIREKKIDEKIIKEKVINKIYKILPQDIIFILQDNNVIKKKYIELKNIYNFKDYINEEENKQYKISIIYTFTSITNTVEGLNKGMSFMVSQIRSEDGLRNLIDEIKNKNENTKLKKEYNICIHFEQSNSEKIKFISNYIINNFKEDNYNYIMIIHINRKFNPKSHERIYSLTDINPDINQLFIDNLNANKMKLNDLLKKDIIVILEENKEDMKLEEEFNKTLKNFITNELNDTILDERTKYDYINEIQNYMNEEESIKEKIIEITFKLINNNKDEETNCKNIIEKIYNINYISKFTIDIVSCLIEYINENIFNKYLKIILKILEDNNILTTLLEIKKNNYKYIDKDLVEDIVQKYLDGITIEKNNIYKSKFLYNYNVPGFYNFYKKINLYINKNITFHYFNNEKNIRKLLKVDNDIIRDFHDSEETLLNNVYNEISYNNKFIIDIINTVPINLIFKDYITYYLQEYRNPSYIYNKDYVYHKLIEELLKLRFNKENKIIKDNDKIQIL